MAEKSILEQALLQVNTLEEAVKQNAKGILSSVMKKELNELLKESEEEDEALKSQEDEASMEDEAKAEDDEMSTEDDEESAEDDEDSSDEEETNDMTTNDFGGDDEENLDNEPGKGIDSLDADGDMGDDEDVTDMTAASDDEVMKVFKAMRPEDGIVVKKDGNTVSFHDGDDEYIIKLDDIDSSEEEEGTDLGQEVSPEGEEDESATLYEIELNESDEEEEDEDTEKEEATEGALKGLSSPKKVEPKESALKGLSHPKKVEPKESALKGLSTPKKVEPKETALKGLSKPKVQADEAARTKSNPHGNKNGMERAGLPSKKMYKAGSGINEEFETLKKQNDEYKKALVLFKDKLNEVAIFNANLAYFTRLVTENSTTKQEKLNILKRFDSVSTMNESKNLFSAIKAELETKKPVNESVANKISSTPSTSSSSETEVLSESKVYENPQFSRMKDLMKKLK
jgi:hypothetical protein